ncbi:MAG: hypothetical protein M0005_06055 [Actinomycetota bacterium]|nr:hypothetical protein [Actinomycetota bacterium]
MWQRPSRVEVGLLGSAAHEPVPVPSKERLRAGGDEHGRVVAAAIPGLAEHLRLEILQAVVLGTVLAGKEHPGDHDSLADCAIP